MTDDTIFHKIIRREIPADIVFENDEIIAFKDIAPSAPVHILFVPKQTMRNLDEACSDDAAILGKLMLTAAEYARNNGLASDGYRVVMNCNEHGGQTVFQAHLHLLAGAPLGGFGTQGNPH